MNVPVAELDCCTFNLTGNTTGWQRFCRLLAKILEITSSGRLNRIIHAPILTRSVSEETRNSFPRLRVGLVFHAKDL